MPAKSPGMYLELTCVGSTPISVIVPYSTKFGFSCSQRWFYPLKELYDMVKNTISTVGGIAKGFGGAIATGVAIAQGTEQIVVQTSKIFGYQLFNEAFQARAWEGEEPVNLSLTLDFFFGMNDNYSGKTEVYDPIMLVMSKTVPKKLTKKGSMIFSPGPIGISVFKDYTDSVFQDLTSIATTNVKNAGDSATYDDRHAVNRTWLINLGYSKDGTKIEKSIFKLSNLIVTQSGFNLSSEVDSDGYPIEGQLTLSVSSQTLIVESDFANPMENYPSDRNIAGGGGL